jgi:hypothetical protein
MSPSKLNLGSFAEWQTSLKSWSRDFQEKMALGLFRGSMEKYAGYLRSKAELQEIILKHATENLEMHAGFVWDDERELERLAQILDRKIETHTALSQQWHERLTKRAAQNLESHSGHGTHQEK